MANKVSILIMNTQGHHFELTNSKMTLQRAGTLDMNWRTAIGHECGPTISSCPTSAVVRSTSSGRAFISCRNAAKEKRQI